MKIIVVGAGPAGLMAAIRAGQLKQEVTLIEKNAFAGRKLLLSGKGRCNLTNTCDLNSFLGRFSANGQFLRDAFKKFFHPHLISFFQQRGLKLQAERQQRVFPQAGRSDSVLEVLKKELTAQKVKVLYKTEVKDILLENKCAKAVALADKKIIPADKIILACGGSSYSFTGSDSSGIKLAKKLGHHIVALKPGLVPLVARQAYLKSLEGLTLKNIRLRFSDGRQEIVSDIGELLFTDFGISGPLVLSLSARVVDWLSDNKKVFAEIDLKPALSAEQLDARLLREIKAGPRKDLQNMFKALLPQRLTGVVLALLKINPHKKANQLTLSERRGILSLLKAWRLDIAGARPLEEAMVTRGGVSLKEVNPRTMESRLVKGLYFCGEMLDVDADTGGFNLQAAFSTGYLAGESAGA
jgi:hypothetical protein